MDAKRTPTVQQHFIAGTLAGISASVILYPIDLVKVRYQVYDKSGNAYKSLREAFRIIIKEEGFIGLYQGLLPSTIASAFSWGGYFFFYEKSKKRKLDAMGHKSAQLATTDHLLSGVEAGSIMVFITNPFWLLKTRLQLQGPVSQGTPRYNGLVDAIRTILKEEGALGFYKGIIPALFLTSHGAVQFASYEWMKKMYQNFMNDSETSDTKHQQPAYLSMTMGGAAKVVASIVTYPYQVIKSRLQQRDEVLNSPRYKGVIHCTRSILKHEGPRGFFKGLIPNCLKVAPNASLTFLVYEECLKVLTYLEHRESGV